MGGCCCCCYSNGVELDRSLPFYHYPTESAEREPFSSHHVTGSALSTGTLVDTNLETSIPDTYRPPPAPMPYDANLGRPHTPPGCQESCGNKSDTAAQATYIEQANPLNTLETSVKGLRGSGCKGQNNIELTSSKELEIELDKSDELKKSSEPLAPALEEEDVCPTCLEEYDTENPKIITKCEHHFHLSCILEWMERSDTCPVCDKEMIFDAPTDN